MKRSIVSILARVSHTAVEVTMPLVSLATARSSGPEIDHITQWFESDPDSPREMNCHVAQRTSGG
jgi:hypothetical protein